MTCPACQASNAAGARFCQSCGHTLTAPEAPQSAAPLERARAVEGERRIVTILFCDVSGSTALAERLDPEEWAEVMNGAFPYLITPVSRYGGTVARLMGDAVLAFFGAPVAHEDDPRRAVLAGLEILAGVAEYRAVVKRRYGLDFHVRVGINTGLVVVGAVGTELRTEYSAMGDAANTAARMEQTAEPGTVQISGHTYRLVAPLFEVEPLGEIEVKGKAEPVAAYRVLRERPGALPQRGIEGLASPLVGRALELRALLASLDELQRGRGQIVTVIGEAGLGKSRLVREARVARQDVTWLEARAFSYQGAVPFAPFTALLRRLLGAPEGESSGYQNVQRRLAEAVGNRAEALAPAIATLLGLELPGEAAARVSYLEPPQLRAQVFQALLELFAALATERPLVLAFDDLHWADPSSLELLEQLLPLTDSAPLMLLALLRPQRGEASWRFHELAARDYGHRHTPLILQPLPEAEARELVANLLHVEELPERVRGLILAKAEGNPFFVEEVIRALLDAELVVRDGDRWRARREIETLTVPDTLMGVITARLDRLEAAPKRVAQTAAVIGREFPQPVLAEVHAEAEELEEAVSELERRELIRLQTRLPARSYAFKHVLTQESAYASLLMSRRRELHRRTAACLERLYPERAGEIARHYLEAREEARALPHLVAAGESAARAYASEEARAWYGKALELLRPGGDPALARRAYEGLGAVLQFGNEAAETLATYQEMLDFAQASEDAPMQVSALNKLALVKAFHLQRQDEAEGHLLEAERIARGYDDALGLVELATIRCGTCLPVGNFGAAVAYLGEAVDIARQLGHQRQLVLSLAHLAMTLTYMTRFDEALAAAEECQRVAAELGDLEHRAEVLSFPVPTCHLAAGEMVVAVRTATEGLAIAEHIGATFHRCVAQTILGTLAQLRGAYGEAIERYRALLELGAGLGPLQVYFAPQALASLLSSALAVGRPLHQRLLAEYGPALAELEPFAGASAWVEMGFTALGTGEPARAEQLFERALNQPSSSWLLERPRALAGLVLAALQRGQATEAARLLDEARTYAEAHALRHLQPLVTQLEGRLALTLGDCAQALERFAQAEAQAAPLQLRPTVWQARLGMAQALALSGNAGGAEEARRGARAVFDEIDDLLADPEFRAAHRQSADEALGG